VSASSWVGITKVGGTFVYKAGIESSNAKSLWSEPAMPHPTDTNSRAQQVRQVTDDLLKQAEPILADIASLLVDTPDEKLFGDNEFALRDKILTLVTVALNARLGEKKVATTAAVSTVPDATLLPPSTDTGRDGSSDSAAKFSARGRTTTAAAAAKGSRGGTKKSD
jgi:hypothetical protein